MVLAGRLFLIFGLVLLVGMLALLLLVYSGPPDQNEAYVYFAAGFAMYLVPFGSLVVLAGCVLIAAAALRARARPARFDLVLGSTAVATALAWFGTITGVIPAPW